MHEVICYEIDYNTILYFIHQEENTVNDEETFSLLLFPILE